MYTIAPLEAVHLNYQTKKINKNHEDEVIHVYSNLEKVLSALNEGVNPQSIIKLGSVHQESSGVLAVDQSGSKVRPPKQIRLYFYIDSSECVIRLLTIGDKNTQKKDNNWCKSTLIKHGFLNKNSYKRKEAS